MAANTRARRRAVRNPKNPRILVVTPEITYLPAGMGNMAERMHAKAGGLADVSASLVSALFDLGADVHVALPHYRRMFHINIGDFISDELRVYKSKLPDDRIHLAEDRIFYYRDQVYSPSAHDNPNIALAFQREVLNNIIPRVQPDLIHCNDWMTGLVPAMARMLDIRCLFTVHNIHTQDITLAHIEDRGIDAAELWKFLYYKRPPAYYEETRSHNPVDLLTSGIFAAHFINTVSPTFLSEIVQGHHNFIPPQVRHEIAQKSAAACAAGILNAPDPSYNPATDSALVQNFTPANFPEGKRACKLALQEKMGLEISDSAPLFFWPSRLDPIQKGCSLLTDILYKTVSEFWDQKLQIVVVANGAYQEVFHRIVAFHDLHKRVAVCDFSEPLSRLAYAASDFMLMPSLFEPCGLPQMISPLYGSLPVVHDTGGLHDTVTHVDLATGRGNGFVFRNYDGNGLAWAIAEAVRFFELPAETKNAHIAAVMSQSAAAFTHDSTARQYINLYENMLERPLVEPF